MPTCAGIPPRTRTRAHHARRRPRISRRLCSRLLRVVRPSSSLLPHQTSPKYTFYLPGRRTCVPSHGVTSSCGRSRVACRTSGVSHLCCTLRSLQADPRLSSRSLRDRFHSMHRASCIRRRMSVCSRSSCVLRVCSFFPSLSPSKPLHYLFLVPRGSSSYDIALGK